MPETSQPQWTLLLPLIHTRVLIGLLSLGFALPIQPGAKAAPPIRFKDVSSESGIGFQHEDGSYGKYFLVEAMSGGLALLDYDLDGDLDIYLLNGAAINRTVAPESAPRNALYRNDGDWKFVDVTEVAGVGDIGMGLGVACADYDNDGLVDLYVNNSGPNVLYFNNGDGTFSDVTVGAGVENGDRVAGGVSFFDMDSDGDLDLYVGNYIKFSSAEHRVHIHKGLPSYPSPLSFDPEPDTLFRNESNGTFVDVSEESGIRSAAGRSMGLVTFDYDDDQDIDVLIANDTQENFLFENDGRGNFEEVGLLAGIAFDYRGKAQASMGVELLDADRDGLLDIYMTSFSEEFATLYQNLGSGFYDDVTLRAGATEATFPHVTWGVSVADFNLDGCEDIFVAAGDLDDKRHMRGGVSSTTAFEVPNILLTTDGNGQLKSLGQDWGKAAPVRASTRGVVAGDLDRDGTVDLVALNARTKPTLLKNDSPVSRSIRVRLIGNQGNRDGFGARITVTQNGISQVRQHRSGRSYQSDVNDLLHFGLIDPQIEAELEVQWLGGKKTEYVIAPGQQEIICRDSD